MGMDVGMDGWMFAQMPMPNANEPSTEAGLAPESCTAYMYTEYSALFSLAKIIFLTHSVSTFLAELVEHLG